MTRAEYANGILEGLGCSSILRYHRGARRALVAIMLAESGHEPCDGHSGARFNLLNTTLHEPGSTPFNSVGVQNYTNGAVGVKAVVATLRNTPGYAGVVSALTARGAASSTVLNAWDRSPWGTHQPLLGEAFQSFMLDRAYYNDLEVGP